jgi:hypothetical protein
MKIKNIFSFLLAALITQSCSDILEESPRSVLNPVGFYTEEAGLKAGVYAAYSNLREIYGEEEHPFRLTILGTDLFTHGKAEVGLPFDYYNPDLNSFAGEVDYLWSRSYRNINLTNTIIASAPNVQMNEELKQRLVSEAKFIRALSYFWLVQQFGDIPLNLQPTIGLKTTAERAPKADVYQAIIEDLIFAEANLEANYPQWGRIRKGAAQHLLSKVYLVLQDWPKAAEYAKKVIQDAETYQLVEDYPQIFHHENQINKEIIFSVQYENDIANSGARGNRTHLFFTNSYSDIPGMKRVLQWGRPWTRYAPTSYLMNLYEPQKDERTDIWRTFEVYYYNDESTLPEGKQLGEPLDPVWKDRIEFHPSLLKYWDPTRPQVNEVRGNKDFIVYRLGETYLIAAEALMMDGKPDEAVTYFNVIRNRAARPGVDFTIEASDLDIDLILDERARELAGEMHRWFDLIRTGKALEQIKAYSPNGADIEARHLLRPIPQNEIDRLTVTLEQNPGY